MSMSQAVKKWVAALGGSIWTTLKAPLDLSYGPLKIARRGKNLAISGLEGNGQPSTIEIYDCMGRVRMRRITQEAQYSLPLSSLEGSVHIITVEGKARRSCVRWER